MGSFDIGTAIIGSGFSGLGMAIRLKQEGIEDFTVLERGDDVGGTWHFNTYPGCACDVPSHLYSFSFAPNPGWSRTYSRQPEILRYLRRCADDFGVRELPRPGVPLGPVGPRVRLRGQARRRRRHRGVGDPDRAGDRGQGRPPG